MYFRFCEGGRRGGFGGLTGSLLHSSISVVKGFVFASSCEGLEAAGVLVGMASMALFFNGICDERVRGRYARAREVRGWGHA